MIFGKTHEEELAKLKTDMVWSEWFAWHPVVLEDGRIAFLHSIYRKRLMHITLYSDIKL